MQLFSASLYNEYLWKCTGSGCSCKEFLFKVREKETIQAFKILTCSQSRWHPNDGPSPLKGGPKGSVFVFLNITNQYIAKKSKFSGFFARRTKPKVNWALRWQISTNLTHSKDFSPRNTQWPDVISFCSKKSPTNFFHLKQSAPQVIRFQCNIWGNLVRSWTWASAEIFPGGATSNFCLSFSGCWRCNANGCSQNALPFLPHWSVLAEPQFSIVCLKWFLHCGYRDAFLFINCLISIFSSTFYKQVII